MMTHPILINRLVVVTEAGVKLCRPSETVLDLLAPPQRSAAPSPKRTESALVDEQGRRLR